MNFKTTLLASACLIASSSAFASSIIPADSIGVEHKGKNVLVLHKVESGETLYSLARRYHASVTKIKSQNPGMSDALKMGQVVKVPVTGNSSEATEVTQSNSTPPDGKTHTVANGEGLYSIARKYHVSASNLREWNHLSSDELKIGQQLIVNGSAADKPTEKTVSATPAPSKTSLVTGNGQTHTVANGEGLYSIARKYQISVQNLREWNDLRSDNITIGQQLVVASPDAPQTTVAKTETKATEPVKTAPTEKPAEKKEAIAAAPEAKPATPTVDATATAMVTPAATKSPDSIGNKEEEKAAEKAAPLVINNSGYVKTVESGMAEAITEGSSSDLFLALHRTAPVGTIMQVRNEMNDQSVFVKVVGKLPDTGENDKVIVKVSKRAYERLAAVDRRFRVQISYMPQQ